MLIGKDASGHRIPGGPYTVWQLALGLPVGLVLWWTRDLWAAGMDGPLVLVIIPLTTAAAVYLLGYLDFTGRNPMYGVVGGLSASMNGMLASSREERRTYQPGFSWAAAKNPPLPTEPDPPTDRQQVWAAPNTDDLFSPAQLEPHPDTTAAAPDESEPLPPAAPAVHSALAEFLAAAAARKATT